MTCDGRREALLQAELAELRGIGSGELAIHLRSCDACRRDADQILAATGHLGKVVRGRRRRGWARAIPIAAAAGLALWLRPAPVPMPTPLPPSTPSVIVAGARPTRSAPAPARDPVAPIPVRASRFVGSAPVVAVAFAPTALVATPLQASAPEPSRKHPTVLPTSDPAVTVLWFE